MSLAERYSDVDPSLLEERMKHDGNLPEGYYRAMLIGAKPKTAHSGSTGFELTFAVKDGPFTGYEVTDTLWDTDHKKSQDRICLFGLRLGVLKRSADGKKVLAVEGKSDFMDVLDTPCIIQTTLEEYESNGKHGTAVRLAFGGCYYADDKDAIAKIGKPVATAASKASGGAGGSKAETKKDAATGNGDKPAKAKVDTSQL